MDEIEITLTLIRNCLNFFSNDILVTLVGKIHTANEEDSHDSSTPLVSHVINIGSFPLILEVLCDQGFPPILKLSYDQDRLKIKLKQGSTEAVQCVILPLGSKNLPQVTLGCLYKKAATYEQGLCSD